MLHYILLFVFTLSLLACPSKPRRRAPVVPALHSDDADKIADTDPAATFKGAGLYLVLQKDTTSGGYQPVVLRISERGVAMLVGSSKRYNAAVVFPPNQDSSEAKALDLSNNGTQAINLLLAFAVGEDNYCVERPLAAALKWAKGKSSTEIKQELLQTNAQPLDVSNSKGILEQQTGVWQCKGS